MSDMVERVARAKWARRQEVARKAGISPPLDDWDDELESLREEVRAETRAAIEALREPTGEMKDAGSATYEAEPWVTGCNLDGQPSKAWRAMIDAVLNSQKSPTAD